MADVCFERFRNGSSSDTCIIAPHGGEIEPHTASQAKQVATHMDCSAWTYEAHSDSDNTFKKYHTKSTQITVEDYPKILELDYPYNTVVAFHGHKEDVVQIGGYAGQSNYHSTLLAELQSLDLDVPVKRKYQGKKAGRSSYNILNRLAKPFGTTIQLEQPRQIRKSRGEDIAECVVKVLSNDTRYRNSPAIRGPTGNRS